MSNDLIPTNEGGFLGKLNVPKLIAGPAGEAISRLIGGAVDIPTAWLAQVAQGIKDKTEAKTVVSKAVAEAAAGIAKNDPEIVQRAAHSLLAKELRHQANREAIARKTMEYIADEPSEHTTKPDDDWLNVFERFAEDASSERLQDIWGRVLAGELRQTRTFSLRTLRFISELDETVAAQFEKWSACVVNFDSIPFPPTTGGEFYELQNLQDCGLVSGVGGTLHKLYDLSRAPEGELVPLIFSFKTFEVRAFLRAPFKLRVDCLFLSNIGRELLTIARTPTEMNIISKFVERFPKACVQQMIVVNSTTGRVETTWQET